METFPKTGEAGVFIEAHSRHHAPRTNMVRKVRLTRGS